MLNQDGRAVLPCCPLCGEIGPPWYHGENPPMHTANRGIMIMVCGRGYYCGGPECTAQMGPRSPGCKRTWVYCYRCTERTDILIIPRSWILVKAT